MLTQPLLDKLSKLHLSGFRAALEEQLQSPHYAELSFEERLGLLVDIETTRRANNRLRRRVRAARFPLLATMEDLYLSAKRGLKRGQVLQLAQSEWVSHHLNLLILGATWVGKTYLLVLLAGLPARPAAKSFTSALPACSSRWNWPTRTAPIPNYCAPWPASICSSLMTGSVTPFPAPRPETCSKSWMTAMVALPPWLSLRSLRSTGTAEFQTPRSLTPSSTVLFTMLIV